MKFVIGVDPHPETHTAAALDENGKVVETLRVENTDKGFEALVQFAGRFEERRAGRWKGRPTRLSSAG